MTSTYPCLHGTYFKLFNQGICSVMRETFRKVMSIWIRSPTILSSFGCIKYIQLVYIDPHFVINEISINQRAHIKVSLTILVFKEIHDITTFTPNFNVIRLRKSSRRTCVMWSAESCITRWNHVNEQNTLLP